MSTVCYCGNTACPVRSMDRDACLDSLRAALTESQADRARLREAIERHEREPHRPRALEMLGAALATDTPNPLLEELRTLRERVASLESDNMGHLRATNEKQAGIIRELRARVAELEAKR